MEWKISKDMEYGKFLFHSIIFCQNVKYVQYVKYVICQKYHNGHISNMSRNVQYALSEIRNLHFFLLEKLLNHSMTAEELRHCKRPNFDQIFEFTRSRSFLLTLPILDLAGVISRHFGLLMKLGLLRFLKRSKQF